MKHELLTMEKQGAEAIVNSPSMAGRNGSAGLTPYSAAKWAAHAMMQTAALEYAA